MSVYVVRLFGDVEVEAENEWDAYDRAWELYKDDWVDVGDAEIVAAYYSSDEEEA